jgi:hypothetical protein
MIFFQRPDNFSNRGLVIDLPMGLVVFETGAHTIKYHESVIYKKLTNLEVI